MYILLVMGITNEIGGLSEDLWQHMWSQGPGPIFPWNYLWSNGVLINDYIWPKKKGGGGRRGMKYLS